MVHEPLDLLGPVSPVEARGGSAPSEPPARTTNHCAATLKTEASGVLDDPMLDACRLAEAVLFASPTPVRSGDLARFLPEGVAVSSVLESLRAQYQGRGIELTKVGNAWAFRTASDLADRLTVEKVRRRKLSRAGLETLAIIAYHAPITRAEIEEIRGVTVSPGTLDILFEEGWIEPRGRKQVPGRPTTWQTTTTFLDYFGLESRNDLPGLRDLRKAGLLSSDPLPVPPPVNA